MQGRTVRKGLKDGVGGEDVVRWGGGVSAQVRGCLPLLLFPIHIFLLIIYKVEYIEEHCLEL